MFSSFKRKRELKEVNRLKALMENEIYEEVIDKIHAQMMICQSLEWKNYKLFRRF